MTSTIDPLLGQAAPADEQPRADHRSESGEPPLVIIDSSPQWSQRLADIRQYRGALYSLASRNIRSRYKQASLGMAWALIQPAVQVGVFTLLFGIIARVPSGDIPYPVFALAGLLPWNLFAKVVSDGSQSLVANQHMITKLFFPRIFVVLAAGASSFIDAAATALMLAAVMIVYGVHFSANTWLVLPAFLGLVLFAYGFAALLAALNARWRDVQHTVPFALQIGLFATPVLYPTVALPEKFRWLSSLNPLSAWIALFRTSLTGAPLPASDVLVPSMGVSLALTMLGFWYFARAERTVVDVV